MIKFGIKTADDLRQTEYGYQKEEIPNPSVVSRQSSVKIHEFLNQPKIRDGYYLTC